MILALIAFVGAAAGIMSGFFGVGGGTVTVPALCMLGIDVKAAVGISLVQMLFGSIFGSYLNYKDGALELKRYLPLLLGGLLGGLLGAYFVALVPDTVFYIMFLLILALAIARVWLSPAETNLPERFCVKLYVLIGASIGIISGLLGVGGAILLTPILVGFLNFGIKKAVAVSLLFVTASSASALTGFFYFGHLNLKYGIVAALFSLAGVWAGLQLAKKTDAKKHKNLLLIVYVITFSILLYKAIIG